MATHTVYLGPVQTTASGTVVANSVGPASTWDYSQTRVLYNASVSNSVGNPTIDAYIALESTAGYEVILMTPTSIVTSSVKETPPVTASVVVAAGPTATVLAANNTFVASCVVVAKSDNGHTIYLGSASSQIVPIAPGGIINITCGTNRKTDLNDYKIYGTAGEGVDLLYTTI